jgi:hypothetical protein
MAGFLILKKHRIEDTTLNSYQQRKTIKVLKELGIIEKK